MEQVTLVSEINITPFNEPGDVMYPDITDQPDGCQVRVLDWLMW